MVTRHTTRSRLRNWFAAQDLRASQAKPPAVG
jgi:hypothetical protein